MNFKNNKFTLLICLCTLAAIYAVLDVKASIPFAVFLIPTLILLVVFDKNANAAQIRNLNDAAFLLVAYRIVVMCMEKLVELNFAQSFTIYLNYLSAIAICVFIYCSIKTLTYKK